MEKLEHLVRGLTRTSAVAVAPEDRRSSRVATASYLPGTSVAGGAQRLADGENFQSVAFGLALIGLEDDLTPWLAQFPGG